MHVVNLLFINFHLQHHLIPQIFRCMITSIIKRKPPKMMDPERLNAEFADVAEVAEFPVVSKAFHSNSR